MQTMIKQQVLSDVYACVRMCMWLFASQVHALSLTKLMKQIVPSNPVAIPERWLKI